jgi:hypothetical protein
MATPTHSWLALSVLLLVVHIYGLVAASLEYDLVKNEVNSCWDYSSWYGPTMIAFSILMVIIFIAFSVHYRRPTRRKSTCAVLLVVSIVAAAGTVISALHAQEVFRTTSHGSTNRCKRPSDDIVARMRWMSASLTAVFALCSVVSIPWMYHEVFHACKAVTDKTPHHAKAAKAATSAHTVSTASTSESSV